MMARAWERKTRLGAQGMTATPDDPLGFASDDDVPIPYMARTRWKHDYNNVATFGAEELARRRREFDAQKDIARGLRESAA
jgi:hypothetical protein